MNKGGLFFSCKKEITLNLLMLGGGGDLANITLSSNGRTTGFGPVNGSSNLSGVTKNRDLGRR